MDAELDMPQLATRYRGHSPAEAYRRQQVLSARPEDLILVVYDYVIAGCNGKDGAKACRGLAELIDALDFDQGEIAGGLFGLYRYSMDRVRKGDFDGALAVMRPLRETWAALTKKETGAPGANDVPAPPGAMRSQAVG